MKVKILSALIVFLLTVFAGNSLVNAQTSRGTVAGTVTDPNGAVVVGATVEIVNKATNLKRSTTTNGSGIYRFDAVDLGVYDVVITSKGFKTITNANVQVQANQTTNLDAQLEIGSDSVVVEVAATSGEILQTTEPVRGGNFSPRQVQNLPLGALNPYDLGRLLPGVIAATGSSTFGNASQFSVNGQRPRGNNYLIDGTENNDISVTGPANQINNEDAVQEVSVQTGLFSAEFGRAGGGVFNIVTKSGTNAYHGTGRWLYLSQKFDALTNGNRLAGLTKPNVYTENVFGGTIGGPLPLPHFGEGGPTVRSGKDRTFFFFGLQYDRFRASSGTSFRVPTVNGAAQLRAIFPQGTNPRLDLYLQAIGNARGVSTLQTIDLGLGPNGAGVVGLRGLVQTGLVSVAVPAQSNNRQWVLRIDHKINDKHQLGFRYLDDNSLSPNAAMNSPGFTRDFAGKSRNFLITHTWIINSGLTNELRVSPYGLIDFDFPISPGAPALAFTLPNISITNLSAVGIATNIPQFRKAKNYLFQDTMTKIVGSHTFRFGAEFLKQTAQQRPPFNERGSFGFVNGGTYTIPGTNPPQSATYTAFANFIDNWSGPSGSANINFGNPIYDPSLFRQSYFGQDTWKVRQNLTLTLGLRYENFGQPANRAFRFPAFAGFDPSQFLVPNKVDQDNNNFGPIVGFSYSPSAESGVLGWLFGNNKSAIRGGYQVSYDTFFNNMLSNIAADSPNNTATPAVVSTSGRGNANFFPGALPSTPRPPSVLDQQTSVFNKNIRNPYTQRWSLGLQRELPWGLFLDASYVASVGRKLFVTEDLNPFVQNNPNVRRFPALGVRRYRTSGANSDYHSGQLRVDKRLSKGVQVTASYTYSKLIDQISEIFATDSTGTSLASVAAYQGGLRLDRAVSDYDRRHRLTLAYVWDLPGPKTGFLGQVIGGWQISGITTFQSGAPFTFLNGSDRNGDGVNIDRPNIGNPNAPHNTRGVIVAAATCATLLQNPDTLQCVTPNDVYVYQVAANTGFPGPATIGRNTERSNRVQNFDMSFFKVFRVKENLRLEYRLDAFNVFNHPQFTGVPARTVFGSAVGSFLNYNQITGGGRSMRMGLKIVF